MTVNRAIIEKRRDEIQALVDDGTLPFFPEIDENGNLPVYTFTEFATLCKTLTFEDPTLPETASDTQVYGTHLWEDFCLQPFIWGAGGDYLNEDATKVLLIPQSLSKDMKVLLRLLKWVDLDFLLMRSLVISNS